jgi:hypothetical protein
MPRKKSLVNTSYVPIGTIAMPPELAEKMRFLAKTSGGMAAVVRAALLVTYAPELIPSNTITIPDDDADGINAGSF